MMVAMLGAGFASCGDDADDNAPKTESNTNNGSNQSDNGGQSDENEPANPWVGTWRCENNRKPLVYIFKKDGSFLYYQENYYVRMDGSYVYNEAKEMLILSLDNGNTITYDVISFANNTLIYQTESKDSYTFTKQKDDSALGFYKDIYTTCPDNRHPHAIDLGLPSGIKWSCCNALAFTPDYVVNFPTPDKVYEYVSWGETKQNSDGYSWMYYKYGNAEKGQLRKYTDYDNKTQLEAEDDIATTWLGTPWRTPSKAECEELAKMCTWTHVTLFPLYITVEGYIAKGVNGNVVFFPATGSKGIRSTYDETEGCYWSSTRAENPEEAWYLCLKQSQSTGEVTHRVFSQPRHWGLCVRPVQ